MIIDENTEIIRKKCSKAKLEACDKECFLLYYQQDGDAVDAVLFESEMIKCQSPCFDHLI